MGQDKGENMEDGKLPERQPILEPRKNAGNRSETLRNLLSVFVYRIVFEEEFGG